MKLNKFKKTTYGGTRHSKGAITLMHCWINYGLVSLYLFTHHHISKKSQDFGNTHMSF
jgi:hypothetical protein